MNFRRSPIFPSDGKRRLSAPTERIVPTEELKQILTRPTRQILKKLLNADPELKIKLCKNDSDKKYTLEFSPQTVTRFSRTRELFLKTRAERKKWCKELCHSPQNPDEKEKWRKELNSTEQCYQNLKAEKTNTIRERRIIQQLRQKLEEILNSDRKPPRKDRQKNQRKKLHQKMPKKLAKIQKANTEGKKLGGHWFHERKINTKSAPYTRVKNT